MVTKKGVQSVKSIGETANPMRNVRKLLFRLALFGVFGVFAYGLGKGIPIGIAQYKIEMKKMETNQNREKTKDGSIDVDFANPDEINDKSKQTKEIVWRLF